MGPGSRQNSGSFALHRDADTDIISLGHSGFRGGNIVGKTIKLGTVGVSKVWSLIAFFLIAGRGTSSDGSFQVLVAQEASCQKLQQRPVAIRVLE